MRAIGNTSALFLAALCAGSALAQSSARAQNHEFRSDSREKNTIHILRSSLGQPGSASGITPFAVTATNLVQGSGPVMRNPTNYLIFWQPPGRAAFPAGYQTGIETFFKRVGGTPFYNIVTQYNDKSGNPAPPNATSWGGSWVDNSAASSGCNGSVGAVGATPNCPLTDGDVQAEVDKAIAANPAWTAPGINVEYFVFTPSDVDECAGKDSDGNASCFAINGGPGPKENSDFCAYHSFYGGTKIYAYQPFAANGSCYPPSNIQATGYPNGANLDIVLSTVSHELIESNTDPHINAWKGTGGNDDEIGDKCSYKYGFVAPDGTSTLLNGTRYQIQTEWSNAVTGCAKRYGNTPALSVPTTLNFGSRPSGSVTNLSLNVTNTGADANLLYVRLGAGSDPAFSVTSLPPTWATIPTPATFAINVRFAPVGAPRNAVGSVILDTDLTPCDTGDSCVTSSNEIVNPLLGANLNPPVISKAFTPSSIPLGGTTTVSFSVSNPNTVALTGVAFTDPLPAGLTAAGAASACGTASITAGGTVIALSGATIGAGAACTITATVTGVTPGVKLNTTNAVTSNEAGAGNAASATLLVVAPPVISKAFAPNKVVPGGVTTLNLTIVNPNSFAALAGVAFSDTLPAGVVIATPNGLTSSCGGVATATAGSGTVSLAGGAIASGGTCLVSAKVTGVSEGIDINSVSVTSTNGGAGNTATATLYVATPPNLSKSFGLASLLTLSTGPLTFTLSNPNRIVTLTGLQFSDTLPAGLLVANPNGLTGSCPGAVITAATGSNLLTFSGATLAPGASCAFTISVASDGTAVGYVTNTTSTVTSVEALPGAPASAVLFIGDPYQLRYTSNLTVGDSVVNISNTGASGGVTAQSGTSAGVGGSLCANVYVFRPDESIVSCCSCPVTPNGLVSHSAQRDLLNNPLTPIGSLTSVVIKLVATLPVAGSCVNSAAGVSGATLANGMVAWGTTLHANTNAGAAAYDVTESAFTANSLSTSELARLGNVCSFVLAQGSGNGVCNFCRNSGQGAQQQ